MKLLLTTSRALTRPSTTPAFSLRLRLHYKAARVGSIKHKMMNREILTYPLSKEQFWAEFRYFVAYFRNMGARECTVLFGFAWGIEYYPEKEWIPETILLHELEERILELERRGLGEFRFNDVFVELADVEFRFCNDTDIHIGFNRQQPLIEDFYSRWQALGYCPAEWLKNEDHGPGVWVRGGEKNA